MEKKKKELEKLKKKIVIAAAANLVLLVALVVVLHPSKQGVIVQSLPNVPASSYDNVISTDDVIKLVHGLPGYEDADVTEIKPILDAENQIKYWSAKTSKGYVTVPADKQPGN